MNRSEMNKLHMWQERMKRNDNAYSAETEKMDRREAQYSGERTLKQIVKNEKTNEAVHVRNISAELIEAQVDSNIPQPKVTARRERDEEKAKLIEDMLRNELDRMPFEEMNDMLERTVPIQGGCAFLVEWDNARRTHFSVGELNVSALHPKQLIPQDGVYTGVEDMDYIILKMPQTKDYIRRKYNVDVKDESEREPDIKGSSDTRTAEDLVTQYIAYYRNDKGGIGLFSWVNDTILEDLEDYQARKLRHCATCGAVEPMGELETVPETLTETVASGSAAVVDFDIAEKPTRPAARSGRRACPYCGGTKWEDSTEEYEELTVPIERSDGTIIPGNHPVQRVSETLVDENGLPVVETFVEPTRIPFYKPDIYPVIQQKNVSLYGKFMGDSDLDKITDQQNTANRIESKIIDKLLGSGSYITLPDNANIRHDTEDMKVIRLRNPADKALIDVFDLQGDISADLAYLTQVYDEARQTIGITDSFQGRRDTTATSGKAKEFAAAQSAGRLESKRVMKNAAYAKLFEAMFKFKLAYTDEPRPVVANDIHGNKEYKEFNRYDFLEQDAAGEWCWNTEFLFSCDTSAPLASNREAMWQETRLNLESGAFGDPTQLQTLILFWTKMEMLHYPGAGETRAYLEEELQRQVEAQQMQAQAAQYQAQQAAAEQAAREQANAAQGDMDQALMQSVLAQARDDAMRDAQRQRAPEPQTSGTVTQ